MYLLLIISRLNESQGLRLSSYDNFVVSGVVRFSNQGDKIFKKLRVWINDWWKNDFYIFPKKYKGCNSPLATPLATPLLLSNAQSSIVRTHLGYGIWYWVGYLILSTPVL